MTFDDFIKKYNGKKVEVAGSANAINQCTDLCNAYLRDVWSLPIVEWTNAVDFPEKITGCEFIENTPEGMPQLGDLVVFKKYGSLYGTAGHIGIIVSADVDKMQIFEQNYPTGSACRIGTHNYLGCRGWLRKKGNIMPDNPDWLLKNSDNWIGTLTYLEIIKSNPTLDDVKDVVGGIKARAIDMEKQKGQAEANLITAEKTISNQTDLLLKAEKAEKDLNTALNDAKRINEEQQGQIKGMIAEHGKLLVEVAELKSKRDYDIKFRVKDYFIGKYK